MSPGDVVRLLQRGLRSASQPQRVKRQLSHVQRTHSRKLSLEAAHVPELGWLNMLRAVASSASISGARVASHTLSRPLRAAKALERWYSACLTQRPLTTKCLTSCIILSLADGAMQKLDKGSGVCDLDLMRMARMAAFGFFVHAPGAHVWFGALERTLGPGQVAAKIMADQLMYLPLISSMAMLVPGALAGQPRQELWRNYCNKLPETVSTGWMFWVPAHYINFSYVTPQYRVLYVSCMQLFFGMFLSKQANFSRESSVNTNYVAPSSHEDTPAIAPNISI